MLFEQCSFPEARSSNGKCNSNSLECNSNSNILSCLQHVIVIERKQSNSNLLHCNVIDPRPEDIIFCDKIIIIIFCGKTEPKYSFRTSVT